MSWIHARPFLRAYRFLPHALVNRSLAVATRARRPRALVDAAIAAWVRRGRIDLADFAPGPYASVEDFFLRRLAPGARPLGDGVVSPVDGAVVAAGEIADGASLVVKGHRLSLDRLVNGRLHRLPLDGLRGGRYLSLFLGPRGYHRVHMPADATLLDVRWLPGRYFPQNEHALAAIAGVYEKNERAVLRLRLADAREALLVMVGASLIGGIRLADLPRAAWTRRAPTNLMRAHQKGDEIGHFTFGSTVVMLLPPGASPLVAEGDAVKMGQPLFR